MSSVSAFNLDKSKMLLFGKELNPLVSLQHNPVFFKSLMEMIFENIMIMKQALYLKTRDTKRQ